MSPLATTWLCGAGAVAAAGGVFSYGMFAPRSPMFCPVISRGPTDCGRVALTFDDGPWPGSTEPILAMLAAAGARATFFVIGRYAAARPELLRRIHAEGHQLANHTYDHHRAGMFGSPAYWESQVRRTDDAIARITGSPPRLFRAPMGFKSPLLAAAIRRTGHTVIAWSCKSRDGITTTPGRIVRNVARAAAGDIILLHDGRDPASRRDVSPTAAALPEVLRDLRARALHPVRLDELLIHTLTPAAATGPSSA
ncbi:MAG: polysaccharide deacetylase family protein [Phycisphaerales bacterium]|nr:polysaccharide deacetylase family protein [Phycisphaerales bacterium]